MAIATLPNTRDTEQLTPREVEEMNFFGYFTEGVVILRGGAGSGKSMTAARVAYCLKKYYGKPVVSDFHFKPAFGAYRFMDSGEFINELQSVSKIAKDKGIFNQAADDAREKLGIKFDNAVIVWDEAYKYLDCRRPGDLLTLTYGYYLQQWRHYHSTVILCTPRFDMIDAKRGLNQVTIELTCSSNFKVTPTKIFGPRDPKNWLCYAKGLDRFTLEKISMRTQAIKYGQLYDSWMPLAIRSRILNKVEE